jgi:hypothetical protein
MVVKIKEISIGRGRKYTQNYQSVDYHVGITIEGTTVKDTVEDMIQRAISELSSMETWEQDRCRNVIDVISLEENREYKETVDNASEKPITREPAVRKQPKSTKKIVANGKYKVAGSPCNRCNGYITWDGWVKGSPPIHVDIEGNIQGNGDCPDFDKGGS